MFFEEESKDTHGNMDDYDLNFEQDESVSWDKLLDDTEPADEGLELASEEKVEADDVWLTETNPTFLPCFRMTAAKSKLMLCAKSFRRFLSTLLAADTVLS